MIAEKVLKALLEAAAGVTALVSTRIYADYRPEGDALPAIVLLPISDIPSPPIDATAGSEPYAARVQVMCCAATPIAVRNLVEQVRLACHKQSGSIAGATVMAVLQDITGPANWDHTIETADQSVDFTVRYLR